MADTEFPGHVKLPEPPLLFSSVADTAVDTHPLRGLVHHGPLGSSIHGKGDRPVLVNAIIPIGWRRTVARLITELSSRQLPRERRQYLPDYPGFRTVYRTSISLAEVREVPVSVEEDILHKPLVIPSACQLPGCVFVVAVHTIPLSLNLRENVNVINQLEYGEYP